jgi:hypothetical protein
MKFINFFDSVTSGNNFTNPGLSAKEMAEILVTRMCDELLTPPDNLASLTSEGEKYKSFTKKKQLQDEERKINKYMEEAIEKRRFFQNNKKETGYVTAVDRSGMTTSNEMTIIILDAYIEYLNEWKEKVQNYQKTLLFKKTHDTSSFDEKIAVAKQYPIDKLIEFNQAGFAKCISHSDKTPSMKYYPKENHVHCFGCGFHGDAIEVIKITRSLSFKEAVLSLTQ